MSCSFGLTEIYRCGHMPIIYLQTDSTKTLLFVINSNVKSNTSKVDFKIGDELEISVWHFNKGFSRLCTHNLVCKENGSICNLLYNQKLNKICLGIGNEIVFLLIQLENKNLPPSNSLFDILNANDESEDFPYNTIFLSLKTTKRVKLPIISLEMVKYGSYIFVGAQDGTIVNISWTGEIIQKWIIPQVHSVFRTASSMLLIVTQTNDLLHTTPAPVHPPNKIINNQIISSPKSTTNSNTNSIEVSEDEFDTFQNSIHYDSIELGEELDDDEDDINGDGFLNDEVREGDVDSSKNTPIPSPVMTHCEYIELMSIVVSLYDDGSMVILQLQDKDNLLQSPSNFSSNPQKNEGHHVTYNCLCSNRMHVILPSTNLPSTTSSMPTSVSKDDKKPKWVADTVSRFLNIKVLNELQQSFHINTSTSSHQLQTEVDTGTCFAALVLTPSTLSLTNANTTTSTTSTTTPSHSWYANETFRLSLLIIRVTSVSNINTSWSGGMSRTLNMQCNCSIIVDSNLLKSSVSTISSLYTLSVTTGVLIFVAVKDRVKVYHVSAQETNCNFISDISNNNNYNIHQNISSNSFSQSNDSPGSATGATTISSTTNTLPTIPLEISSTNSIKLVTLKKHILISSSFYFPYPSLTPPSSSTSSILTANNSLLLIPILLNPKSSLTPTANNILLDINENSDISTILIYTGSECGVKTTHFKSIYSNQGANIFPKNKDDDYNDEENEYEKSVQEIFGKFVRIPLPTRLIHQVKQSNIYCNTLLNTINNDNQYHLHHKCNNKNNILISQSNRYIICVTEEMTPKESEKTSFAWESAVMIWILDRQGQGKWKSMVLPNTITPLHVLPVTSPHKHQYSKLSDEVTNSSTGNIPLSTPRGSSLTQENINSTSRPGGTSSSSTNNNHKPTNKNATNSNTSPSLSPVLHMSPWKQLAGCTAAKEIEKPIKKVPLTSDVLGHAESVFGLTNFGCHSIILVTIRKQLHPTNNSHNNSQQMSTVSLLEVVSREQSKNTLVWKSADYRQVVGTPQSSAAIVLPDSLTPTYLDVVMLPGSMSVTIPEPVSDNSKHHDIPSHQGYTYQRKNSNGSNSGHPGHYHSPQKTHTYHNLEEDNLTTQSESEINDSRHSSFSKDEYWSSNDYSSAYSHSGNDEMEDDMIASTPGHSHSHSRGSHTVTSPKGNRSNLSYDVSSVLSSASPYRHRSISQESSSHSSSTSTFYHLEKSKGVDSHHIPPMSRPPIPPSLAPSTTTIPLTKSSYPNNNTTNTTTGNKKKPKALAIPKDTQNKMMVSCAVVVGGNNMEFLCFQITAIFESSAMTSPLPTSTATATGTTMSLLNNKFIPKEYKIDHLWSIDQSSSLGMTNDINMDLLWPLRSISLIPVFKTTSSKSSNSNDATSPYANYSYNHNTQTLSEVRHHSHLTSTTSAADNTTTNHEHIQTTISLYILDGMGKLFLLSPPILPPSPTSTTSPPQHHLTFQEDYPVITVDYLSDNITAIEKCQNSKELPLSLQYILVTYPDTIPSNTNNNTSFSTTLSAHKKIHIASLSELGVFSGPVMINTSQSNEPLFHEEYFGALGNEGGTLILSLQCYPLHLETSAAPTPSSAMLLDGGSARIHCESLIVYIIDALLNSVMHTYVNHEDQTSHHSTASTTVHRKSVMESPPHQLDVTGLLKSLLLVVRKKPRESQLLVQCLERKWRDMVEETVKAPDTHENAESTLKYALLSSLLFSCDELLLIEVLSRLGRKLEPESRQYLFPLPSIDRVYSSDISTNRQYEYIDSPWTPLALYELCLSRCRLHHAARLLTLACEAGGGAVNRTSSATSLVLALELLTLSLSHLSLRIAKECLDFCLRLELLSGRRIHQQHRNNDRVRHSTQISTHSNRSNTTTTTLQITNDRKNVTFDDEDEDEKDITADDFDRQDWKSESNGWGDGWLSSLSSVVTTALSLYPGYQSSSATASHSSSDRPKVGTLCPSESTRQWTTALAIEHQMGVGGFASLLCDGSGSATLMAVALLSCDMLSSRRFYTASMVVLSVVQSTSSSHAIIHQIMSALDNPLLQHKSSLPHDDTADYETRQQQEGGVEAAHILEALRALRLHKVVVSQVEDVLKSLLSPTALRQRCESELLQHQLGGKRRSSSTSTSTTSSSHQPNNSHGDDTTKLAVDSIPAYSNNLLSSSESSANYFELPSDFLRKHTHNSRKGPHDNSLIDGVSLRTIVKGLILSTAIVGDWSLCVLLLMLLGRCELAASCVNNNNSNSYSNSNNSNNKYLIAKSLYKFCCHESDHNNSSNNIGESEGGSNQDNLSTLSDNPLTVQLQGIILSRKSQKVSELISTTCQMLETFRTK